MQTPERSEAAYTANVPCGGCTLCCRGDMVRLLPGDDPSRYLTAPHEFYPGQLRLARDRHGDCVYLTEDGCSIHGQAPQMCREFDCRLLAQRTHTSIRKEHPRALPVYWRGKELLREAKP